MNISGLAAPFKKLLCVALAGAFTASAAALTAYADETELVTPENEAAQTSDTPESYDMPGPDYVPVLGDVDFDSLVTSNDALLILRYSIQLERFSDTALALADMDHDGAVDSADALLALKQYLDNILPSVVVPEKYTAVCGERLDLHPTLSDGKTYDDLKFTYEIYKNADSTDGYKDENEKPFTVLEMTNKGQVKAFHPGTAVVKVSSKYGFSAFCEVTVIYQVTKQTISSGGRSLTIYKEYMTNNDCYNMTDEFEKVQGVAVHSTATPGVMAADWYSRWNRPATDAAVHSFLDNTCVYNYLPLEQTGWHAGQPANKMFLDFEICEPGSFYYDYNSYDVMWSYDPGSNKAYFDAIWANATLYTAYLCKLNGLNADSVLSHNEIGLRDLGTHHSDPDHWFAKHGRTMDDFRKDVARILAQGISVSEETAV